MHRTLTLPHHAPIRRPLLHQVILLLLHHEEIHLAIATHLLGILPLQPLHTLQISLVLLPLFTHYRNPSRTPRLHALQNGRKQWLKNWKPFTRHILGILSPYLPVHIQSATNGSTKGRRRQMALLTVIRPVWLPVDLHRNMAFDYDETFAPVAKM